MQNEKRNVNIFGYARVSSTEQNLDRQIVALKDYVKPENIVVDKVSGKERILTERDIRHLKVYLDSERGMFCISLLLIDFPEIRKI